MPKTAAQFVLMGDICYKVLKEHVRFVFLVTKIEHGHCGKSTMQKI